MCVLTRTVCHLLKRLLLTAASTQVEHTLVSLEQTVKKIHFFKSFYMNVFRETLVSKKKEENKKKQTTSCCLILQYYTCTAYLGVSTLLTLDVLC